MARRKNTKRIDPRYFLNETVNRDINTGEALEEEREAPVTHWIAGPDGLTDQHGDVFVKHGTAFAATRKPSAGQGMMVIGVGHGTGTERWFGERPVPYEDVQKHRSNPNYNPPQPGPNSRTARNSPVVQEEGWDDIKAGAGKAWKKAKRGAEDAWDTLATTASDIKHSPTDLGAKFRRKRKSAADEKRQKYADEDAKYAAKRAGKEKSSAQDRESRRREKEFKEKHGMSSAEYKRQQGVAAKASNRDWLEKGPSAKEKADRQRRKDKGDAGLKNPEHMKTQKSNVAYAGSGGVGKSGKRFEE